MLIFDEQVENTLSQLILRKIYAEQMPKIWQHLGHSLIGQFVSDQLQGPYSDIVFHKFKNVKDCIIAKLCIS